jgi:hypothetical protein
VLAKTIRSALEEVMGPDNVLFEPAACSMKAMSNAQSSSPGRAKRGRWECS